MISLGLTERFAILKSESKTFYIDRTRGCCVKEPEDLGEFNETKYSNFLGTFFIDNIIFLAFSNYSELIYNDILQLSDFHVVKISTQNCPSYYIETVLNGLKVCNIYHKENGDISLSLQLQYENHRPRPAFIWNNQAIKNTEKLFGDASFSTPVMSGFIYAIEKTDHTILLISRRSNKRAGTRYWTRGCDKDGYVANFVETEELIIKPNEILSFVQIRGSIPVRWSQYPDLLPQARLRVSDKEDCRNYFDKHMEKINKEYGPVVGICLTEFRGKEKVISQYYTEFGQNSQFGKVTHFPLNSECRRGFGALQKMVAAADLDKIGYTKIVGLSMVKRQNGVVRINCLDNLDRTNLAQSTIAAAVFPEYDAKEAWMVNGDAISLQYSGAPALKRDVVATGKRTAAGLAKDATSSVTRYILNTWFDGPRQDAFDAMTEGTLPAGKRLTWGGLLFAIFALLWALVIAIVTRDDVKKAVRDLQRALVSSPSFIERNDYADIKNTSK